MERSHDDRVVSSSLRQEGLVALSRICMPEVQDDLEIQEGFGQRAEADGVVEWYWND